MFARLRTLWEGISTSLWFLPGLLAAGAVGLAWLAIGIPLGPAEETVRETLGPDSLWSLHSGTAEDAANLLSALLTSMITMATLALSITMVVLTLAAGQLGPRLIRSFMADRRTQLMLGFFLATIVYLILVLRRVNGGEVEAVPHLAVTLGSLGVLICVFLLLLFVHHLAHSIVADSVIERVGGDLDEAVAEGFPEAGAEQEEADREETQEDEAGEGAGEAQAGEGSPAGGRRDPGDLLCLPGGGYVQAIDYGGLVDCAREAGAVIALDFRPGNHLLPRGRHGRVRPAGALEGEKGAALRHAIARCVVLGKQRTAAQDVEFAVRQLVEVALRALSPGINDPYTAVAVIDRLGLSLAEVARRGPARRSWRDGEGTLRVTGSRSSFRGLVDAAFNQIRQAGAGKPAILIRLQATLAELAEQELDAAQRRVIADHVGLIAAAGERAVEEPYDLAALEERTQVARRRLAG